MEEFVIISVIKILRKNKRWIFYEFFMNFLISKNISVSEKILLFYYKRSFSRVELSFTIQ